MLNVAPVDVDAEKNRDLFVVLGKKVEQPFQKIFATRLDFIAAELSLCGGDVNISFLSHGLYYFVTAALSRSGLMCQKD